MFKFLLSAYVLATTAAVAVSPQGRSSDMTALHQQSSSIVASSLDTAMSGLDLYTKNTESDLGITLTLQDDGGVAAESSYIVFSSYTNPSCEDPSDIYTYAGTKLADCESYSNETNPDWHSYSIRCADEDSPGNASVYTLVFDFYPSTDCSGPVNFTAPVTSPSTCEADSSDNTYLLLFTKASCERSDAPWEDGRDGVTQLFYALDNQQCACEQNYGMFSKLYLDVCVADSDGNSWVSPSCAGDAYEQDFYNDNVICQGPAIANNHTLAVCRNYTGIDSFSSSSEFCSADMDTLCIPSGQPSGAPTGQPSPAPSTAAPTAVPTLAPTADPSVTPTLAPTATPTIAPTAAPTAAPTRAPTHAPTSRQERADEDDDDSSNLSDGEVAGVVIGVLAGVGIIGGVGYYVVTGGLFSADAAGNAEITNNLL